MFVPLNVYMFIGQVSTCLNDIYNILTGKGDERAGTTMERDSYCLNIIYKKSYLVTGTTMED